MALPLQGVNVLDLTNVMAGPYCTMVLGDMGARIVKIENFPEGDASRRFDPKVNGESYCYAVLNRGKKSVALDMKDPRGKAILLELAARADVVVENFRPGVVKKLGLDYEAIRALNPGVIYASMSGFGQTGPYGTKGGFDIIAQGVSGIMMMTGYPGGRPVRFVLTDGEEAPTYPVQGDFYSVALRGSTKELSSSTPKSSESGNASLSTLPFGVRGKVSSSTNTEGII